MDKSMFLRKGAEIKSLISQIKELNEDKEAAVDGLYIMNWYIYIFSYYICFSFLHFISSPQAWCFAVLLNISFCIILRLAFQAWICIQQITNVACSCILLYVSTHFQFC